MTEPLLDALTMDERIRLAAGRPVASVEDRVFQRAAERRRLPDPTGDDVLRAGSGGKLRRIPERSPTRPPKPKPDPGTASLASEFARVRARRPKRRRIGPSPIDVVDAQRRFGF